MYAYAHRNDGYGLCGRRFSEGTVVCGENRKAATTKHQLPEELFLGQFKGGMYATKLPEGLCLERFKRGMYQNITPATCRSVALISIPDDYTTEKIAYRISVPV